MLKIDNLHSRTPCLLEVLMFYFKSAKYEVMKLYAKPFITFRFFYLSYFCSQFIMIFLQITRTITKKKDNGLISLLNAEK